MVDLTQFLWALAVRTFSLVTDRIGWVIETRFSEYHVEMGTTTRKVMEGFSSVFAQMFAWINVFFKSRTQKRRCYRTFQNHQIWQKWMKRRVQPVSKLIFSWIWWLHEIPILSTRSVIRHYFSLLNWTSKTNTRLVAAFYFFSCLMVFYIWMQVIHISITITNKKKFQMVIWTNVASN